MGALRRSQEVAPVLSGRHAEPSSAGPEEAALLGEPEQVGRLLQRYLQLAEVLLGQLAPRVAQQLHEGRRLFFQAALQRALAHAQLARYLIAARLAVRKPTDDCLAHTIAGQPVIEVFEVLAGVA